MSQRGHLLVRALKGQNAEQQFVEDHAERIQVGAVISGQPQRHLWSHVFRRAHRHAKGGQTGVKVGAFAQAEVSQVDVVAVALALDEDVAGLQVAVQHIMGVPIFQRLGDRAHNLPGGERRKTVVAQDVFQRRPSDELHDDVQVAAPLAVGDHRDDVRVAQRDHQLGLAPEARAKALFLSELRQHDLQRDRAARLDVVRRVDAPHAPRPNRTHEHVAVDVLPDQRAIHAGTPWLNSRAPGGAIAICPYPARHSRASAISNLWRRKMVPSAG